MKSVLSYALLIGVAVAGGMAIGDKPKDQTQAWKDYYARINAEKAIYEAGEAERNKKPEYASIMLDPEERWKAELFYKCRISRPVSSGVTHRIRDDDEDEEDSPTMFKWTPTYSSYSRRESSEESSWIGSKPDLSGIYSTAPMSGPNSGQVQFNYVRGPF